MKIKNIILSLLGMIAVGSLYSCDDWTDVESTDIETPNYRDENSAEYKQYIADLIAYKDGEHKITYVQYDNKGLAVSQADIMNVLPDSIDIVSLNNPDDLTASELKDIQNIRKKGTKVIYTVDFAVIEAAYNAEKKTYDAENKENPDAEPFPSFAEYMAVAMENHLALYDKYDYDGVTFAYQGKGQLHMTEAQKFDYTVSQNAFFSKVIAWKEADVNRMLIYQGKTCNFIGDNISILNGAKYIILTTDKANSALAMYQYSLSMLGDNVPTDRFLFIVSTFSLDPADVNVGYFTGRKSAITEAAIWIAEECGEFTKAGIAISDVRRDYFNLNQNYQYTRGAIDIISTSPLK